MKKTTQVLSLFLSFGIYFLGHAQLRLVSGNIAGLKGVNVVNIEYDYSKMGVGAFKTEEDYLEKKRNDYKDNPGKFEKFKEGWFGARKSRYEPKFENLFSKFGARCGISGINYSKENDVTLIVTTDYIEPGFNAHVVRKDASANFELTFLDKNGKEIVRYTIRNVRGLQAAGFDYDTGSRVVECYAKAAKMLMKDVCKRLKKMK